MASQTEVADTHGAIAGSSRDDAFDLAVIGGGINGCGIARDASGRGACVALFEKDDLAGATSSASTKLIHGGLRYLEHDEFRLVREALLERERLWRIAPHIIWPLRFVLPHPNPSSGPIAGSARSMTTVPPRRRRPRATMC